jgi:hypothetical protein
MNDVSFKSLLINNLTTPSTCSTTDVQKTIITTTLCECKICEASDLYTYYGAIACESCKIFLKRNAENGQVNYK